MQDPEIRKKENKEKLIQLVLLLVTIVTTTLSGVEWIYGRSVFYGTPLNSNDIIAGLNFSIPFLLILTIHEFGHYLTARYHKVKTTLPFFIPFIPIAFSIGTMGAVIKIRDHVQSKLQHFDIGIAGPLAGFVAALIVLTIGFTNLPEKDYVFEIHPEYALYGNNYDQHVYDLDTVILKKDLVGLTSGRTLESYPDTIKLDSSIPNISIGQNLTFYFFENFVADPDRLPDHREMMHYPWLFAGFLALFFTALNLLPIGQLDGGHVIYGLFGRKIHSYVSAGFFVLFTTYAGIGVIDPHLDSMDDLILKLPIYLGFLYLTFSRLSPTITNRLFVAVSVLAIQYFLKLLFPEIQGFNGWLLFAFFIGRFLGIYHPPAIIEEKLDQNRTILGWIALVVFIISVSPMPIVFE